MTARSLSAVPLDRSETAVRTVLILVPKTAAVGGRPLRDAELLAWCSEVSRSVLADLPRT
jgi:transcription-repair coupling factor (superfamily II helicase)